MTLTNHAINRLADSLAAEVADYIFSSEEWVTLCHDLVPHKVTLELGEVEDDLLFELSVAIMDRITVNVIKPR